MPPNHICLWYRIEPSLMMNVDEWLEDLHNQQTDLLNEVIPNMLAQVAKIDSEDGKKLLENCDVVNLCLGQNLRLLPEISANLQQADATTIFKGVHMNLTRNEAVLNVSELSKEEGEVVLLSLLMGLMRVDGSTLCQKKRDKSSRHSVEPSTRINPINKLSKTTSPSSFDNSETFKTASFLVRFICTPLKMVVASACCKFADPLPPSPDTYLQFLIQTESSKKNFKK
ncbi:hypothetical protein Tco_1291156 [Tanacetum coccineum]